jgi:hypothetical protein
MKNIRSFLVLLAVAATIAGIILIGNVAPYAIGCFFSAAAVAYFFRMSLFEKVNK